MNHNLHPNDMLNLLALYPGRRNDLLAGLQEYALNRQRRVFARWLTRTIVVLLAILLLFLLLERTPLQSELIRYLLSFALYASIGSGLFLAVRSLFFPPAAAVMAREIESAVPRLSDALVSAAEFSEADARDHGASEALMKLTVATTSAEFSPEDRRKALKRFTLRPIAATLLWLAVFNLIWLSLAPAEFRLGVLRLLKPWTNLGAYTALDIQILPGNRLIARGESVQISAIPNTHLEREPVLRLFKPGTEESTVTEMYPDETASRSMYVFTLTALQESTDYQVAYDRFVSERFNIKVLPRPEVRELQLTLYQPAYVSSEPQALPVGTGDAMVLTGSRVRLVAKASQPLKKAELGLVPGATLTCRVTNDVFEADLTPATSTTYSIQIVNEHGLANENPVRYRLTVIEDATPTVAILKPGADTPFPKTKRLDLKVSAQDDFGVVSCVMHYAAGSRGSWIPQNLKPNLTPRRQFEVDFPWMLDTIPVEPGTVISYYVMVEDGCQPQPHVATSPTYKVSMPSMYDVYRGTEEAQQDIGKQMQEYVEAQKLRQQALSRAYEEIRHEGRLDEESEKQLQKAIQEGEEQIKQAEEIVQNFQQVQEKLKDSPFSSPEALEKMQKVNELLEQVLDDEAKKMMKQLRESMQEIKLDPKDLEKFEQAFKMEDYMKNLDHTINLLDQLKNEMEMNALGEALQDLHRRQERLASATKELEEKAKPGEPLSPDQKNRLEQIKAERQRLEEQQKQNGPLSPDEQARLEALKAEQQKLENQEKKDGRLSPDDRARLEDLKTQQEKIKQELEELQKKAQEMAQRKPPEGEQQKGVQEDLKNIADRMKQEDFRKMSEEIKKNLDENKFSDAQQTQQQMLKFLESLSKEGKKVCEACSGSGQQQQLDLSRWVKRALQVSFDQELLIRQLDGLPGQFMRGQMPAVEGRVDESSMQELLVKKQAQDLENALDTLVRSSFTIDPDLMNHFKGVQGLFGTIVKDLEDRAIDKSRGQMREIVRRFNLLAMDLMRAQDDQSQNSSSNPRNALQQFKQLMQRQLSLYQQMQKMQQMNPNDARTMQQLQQMAMEQRMIREALEKLMRESRRQNQTLGRMDDVLKDMEDLETKILDPKLRREVAEKQKDIYDRMLKATKSLKRRDEESEERKAEKVKRELVQTEPEKPLPQLGSNSVDLSKDYLGELKEEFPRTYETELRDYYKSLNLYGTENR